MSEKRKDNRGRLLRNGEMQMPDGRYRFKWRDSFGTERVVYSWRLDNHDTIPAGKRKSPSLRELEKQIQLDLFDSVSSFAKNIKVLELVKRYTDTKVGVRNTTKANYNTCINLLKKDPFGGRRIDSVKISDAKNFLIRLQKEEGKSYSSIHNLRSVLKPAFQLAVDDDLIRKNPFGFQLVEVIYNDSVTREAVTKDEVRRFLKFIKEDEHFCRYYEGVYILFNTGLRISEFCGLTLKDVDFENHCINVDHQLQKHGSTGYYIEKTKSKCGTRTLPMSPDVEECFRKIIEKRNPPKVEPSVEGYEGFLYFDKNGSIMHALHWEHYFKHMRNKYNSIYKLQIPLITPHVCRHTYCSNMARKGINPKTLQYLMGHADIATTLNTYTHVKYEDAKEEILKYEDVI